MAIINKKLKYYSGNTEIDVYYNANWSDVKYRVITLKAPPSETLLNWLNKYSIKAAGGMWVLNNDVDGYPPINLPVEFISNGQLFYGLSYNSDEGLCYWVDSNANETEMIAILNSNRKIQFNNEAHRTIIFLGPPTGQLLEWLNYCEIKQ